MKVGGCGMKEVRGEPIHTIFTRTSPAPSVTLHTPACPIKVEPVRSKVR